MHRSVRFSQDVHSSPLLLSLFPFLASPRLPFTVVTRLRGTVGSHRIIVLCSRNVCIQKDSSNLDFSLLLSTSPLPRSCLFCCSSLFITSVCVHKLLLAVFVFFITFFFPVYLLPLLLSHPSNPTFVIPHLPFYFVRNPIPQTSAVPLPRFPLRAISLCFVPFSAFFLFSLLAPVILIYSRTQTPCQPQNLSFSLSLYLSRS